jgi:hypothetical protein
LDVSVVRRLAVRLPVSAPFADLAALLQRKAACLRARQRVSIADTEFSR